jgi:hypothetical protein
VGLIFFFVCLDGLELLMGAFTRVSGGIYRFIYAFFIPYIYGFWVILEETLILSFLLTSQFINKPPKK